MRMKKINASEITWYEDGNLAEWWEYDQLTPNAKCCEHYTLKETIEIARKQKLILYIQPAIQDQTLIVDYTED